MGANIEGLGSGDSAKSSDIMELCGKGASMTEVLQNEAVPIRMQTALRTLNLCMKQVVVTNDT